MKNMKDLGGLDPDFVQKEGEAAIRRTVYRPEYHGDIEEGDWVYVQLELTGLKMRIVGFGQTFEEDGEARYAYGEIDWTPFVKRAVETSPDDFDWTEDLAEKAEKKLHRNFACEILEVEVEQVVDGIRDYYIEKEEA